METVGNGGNNDGIGRFVNVVLVMSQLRELNEYWKMCAHDSDGVPIEAEKPKINFTSSQLGEE